MSLSGEWTMQMLLSIEGNRSVEFTGEEDRSGLGFHVVSA